MSKIFIQIASYRDPQLVPTIKDCIAQAANPDDLVFCIAWQHGPDENIDELLVDPRVKVIDIDYRKSKGACWARNQIQQRYDGETYTLQLDSHHRFAKGWDTTCIQMMDQLRSMGHAKPLLTGYISSFDPDNDPAGRINVPWKMNFDRFIPEGAVFFLPASIDEHVTLSAPVAARFYSAHFCFTLGQFCKEVPHDPNYYFHGEEISIAARAFTWGYNLFHPHKVIAWHEYTRKGRTKHWDDHNGAAREQTDDKKDWGQRNADCHKRNRCLFSMDGEKYESIEWGPYGFGPIRTLRDYEKYAGINFKKRAVQQFTLDKKYHQIRGGTTRPTRSGRTRSFRSSSIVSTFSWISSLTTTTGSGACLLKTWMVKSSTVKMLMRMSVADCWLRLAIRMATTTSSCGVSFRVTRNRIMSSFGRIAVRTVGVRR